MDQHQDQMDLQVTTNPQQEEKDHSLNQHQDIMDLQLTTNPQPRWTN